MAPQALSRGVQLAIRSARASEKRAHQRESFTGKKPLLLLYLGIGMVALLKDLLDWVLVGSLPGIGTIITFCFNVLIFLLFLFDRSGGRRKSNRMLARGLVLIFITLVEGIGFGLNFLPFETMAVAALYIMANRAYKKGEKEETVERAQKTRAERLAEQQERMRLEALQAQAVEAERTREDSENEAREEEKQSRLTLRF